MAVTFKCAKCGAENRLGQLFCRECGAKLDLSQLKPGHTGSAVAVSAGKVISRVIKLAISVALLAVLGLLCWGVPATGDAPTPNGAQLMQTKMSALRGAIMRKNDIEDTISESDINSHLSAVLTGSSSGNGLLTMSLVGVNVDLKPDTAFVFVKTKLGAVPLTYSTEVKISRRPDGQMEFSAGKVRIGHFTVPGPLRQRILDQIINVFAGLQEEIALLNRLGQVHVVDGAIIASTMKK